MAEQPTRRAKRADIQGLRALAVGLVVLAHAGVPGVAGGFIGVDVFFVLSGFLITGLLIGESEKSGRISISGFYSRRARRILPAATVVLVATIAYVAWQESAAALKSVATDALWSAFFLANVHLANIGTDYSEDAGSSPMQHFWSLAVEEQFYVVWPLLFLALVAAGASRRRTAVVVSLVWAASLGWSLWATHDSPITAYFSSPARAYELATGALVAVAAPALTRLHTRLRPVLAVLGLAAIVLAAMAYDGATPFPSAYALLPVLGTAAVLAAGTGTDDPPQGLLSMQPFQHIGDLSYSIYLWHWPVLLYGQSRVDGWVGTVLLVALTLLLSELSYRLVEVPFQHGRVPRMRSRFALVLWPASVAVVVASTSLASGYADSALQQREAEAASYYKENPEALKEVSEKRVEKEIRQSLKLADKNAPIPPKLQNGESLSTDIWQDRFDCYASIDDSKTKICPVGDTSAAKTVVLTGDSHAGMWLTALDELGKQEGFKVVPLIKIGCAPYDVPQTYREDPFPSCPEFRAWSRERIAEIGPDAIVLGHRGLNFIEGEGDRSPEQTWESGVQRTVDELTGLAPEVKVLADIPKLPWKPDECLTEADSTMASCTAPVEGPEIDGNELTQRALESSDADYVPVLRLVCQGGRCPLVVGDTVTYRDVSHLSVSWNKVVAQRLGQLLDLDLDA